MLLGNSQLLIAMLILSAVQHCTCGLKTKAESAFIQTAADSNQPLE